MSKKLLIILPALALVLAACNQAAAPEEPAESMQDSTEATSDAAGTMPEGTDSTATDTAGMSYTMAQVAEHDNPEDCWLALEGKVYDVSGFADQHPGGEAVYMGCGADATEIFNDRPNGSGAHSEEARSFLPNFYIGDLAQ